MAELPGPLVDVEEVAALHVLGGPWGLSRSFIPRFVFFRHFFELLRATIADACQGHLCRIDAPRQQMHDSRWHSAGVAGQIIAERIAKFRSLKFK